MKTPSTQYERETIQNRVKRAVLVAFVAGLAIGVLVNQAFAGDPYVIWSQPEITRDGRYIPSQPIYTLPRRESRIPPIDYSEIQEDTRIRNAEQHRMVHEQIYGHSPYLYQD